MAQVKGAYDQASITCSRESHASDASLVRNADEIIKVCNDAPHIDPSATG